MYGMDEKHVVEISSGSDSHSGDLPPFRTSCFISQQPSATERQRRTSAQTTNSWKRKKTVILAELPGGCPASDPRGVGDRNTDRATAHPTHSNSYITHLSCLTHAKPGPGPDPNPSRGHPQLSTIAFGRSLVPRHGRMAKIDGLGEGQEGQNGITTHQ